MSTFELVEQGKLEEVAEVPKLEQGIGSLAFSPDGSRLAVGCENGVVLLLGTGDFSTIKKVTPDEATIDSMVWVPESGHLIAASRMGWVALDGDGKRKTKKKLQGWLFPRVALSRDGSKLAVSDDKRFLIYDVGNKYKQVKACKCYGNAMGICFSADGEQVYVGSFFDHDPDKMSVSGRYGIEVWDVATAARVHEIEGHEGVVLDLELSRDGKTLYSGSDDARIGIWDLEGKALRERAEGNGKEGKLSFSPDGSVLAAACISRVVSLRNPKGGEMLWHETWDNYCTAVDFSPDGTLLAAGDDRGTLRVWRIPPSTSSG